MSLAKNKATLLTLGGAVPMVVVVITLLAAFFMQTGYLSWKVAADRLPKADKITMRSQILLFLTSPLWLFGMFATAIGWLLFIKATDLGELTIVQPLMSAGDMILAVLIATLYLGERLDKREWYGIVSIIIGAMVISAEAAVKKPSGIDWQWTSYVLLVTSILGSGAFFYSRKTAMKEIPLSLAVGAAFGCGALLTKLLTAKIYLTGKALGVLSVIADPILAPVLAANLLGIALLLLAFQNGRAVVIIPVQLALTNGFVLVGASLMFSEAITAYRFIGMGLIVAGTALLHYFTPVDGAD